MSQRIESSNLSSLLSSLIELEGSNHPSFVFKENIEEFKSINPFYSSKLHENKTTTIHNHLVYSFFNQSYSLGTYGID